MNAVCVCVCVCRYVCVCVCLIQEEQHERGMCVCVCVCVCVSQGLWVSMPKEPSKLPCGVQKRPSSDTNKKLNTLP